MLRTSKNLAQKHEKFRYLKRKARELPKNRAENKIDKFNKKAAMKANVDYLKFGKTLFFLGGLAMGIAFESFMLYVRSPPYSENYYDFQRRKMMMVRFGDGNTNNWELRMKRYKVELALKSKELGIGVDELPESVVDEIEDKVRLLRPHQFGGADVEITKTADLPQFRG